MEPNYGRLRAALIAGKIKLSDEAFSTLIAGLNGIAFGYRAERVVNSEVKTDTELKKELSRLHRASRTILGILDADTTGLGQIEVLLSDAWDGSGLREFVEELATRSPVSPGHCIGLRSVVQPSSISGSKFPKARTRFASG